MSKENPIYLKLSTVPEENDSGVAYEPIKGGRIKLTFAVFRDNMSALTIANLFVILAAAPIAFLFFYYLPSLIAEVALDFNFMGSIGIGYPGGASVLADGQVAVYEIYQYIFCLTAPCLVLLGLALTGYNHLAHKLIRGHKYEKLRHAVKDYFIGIKKYWLNSVLSMTLAAGFMLAGVVSILFHLTNMALGTADGGSWVLFIFTILLEIPLLMIPLYMIPMSVCYKQNFFQIIKNSAILFSKTFIPGLIIAAVCAAPIALALALSNLTVIIGAMYYLFGFMLSALGLMMFATYNYDLLLNPVYDLQHNVKKGEKEKERTKKEKGENPYKTGEASGKKKQKPTKAAKVEYEIMGDGDAAETDVETQENTAKNSEKEGENAEKPAKNQGQNKQYVNPKKQYNQQHKAKQNNNNNNNKNGNKGGNNQNKNNNNKKKK